MEAKDKALIIYRMVKSQVDLATRDEIAAHAHLAGQREGYTQWLKNEDDNGGGFGGGRMAIPYDVTGAEKRLDEKQKRRTEWNEILDFTVERFLDGVKP